MSVKKRTQAAKATKRRKSNPAARPASKLSLAEQREQAQDWRDHQAGLRSGRGIPLAKFFTEFGFNQDGTRMSPTQRKGRGR